MDKFEMMLEDNDDGVFAISLVKKAAIKEDFIYLKEHETIELKTQDEEEHLLIGAALIPNKLIYRRDADGTEYNIYFSAETIKKASQLYLQDFFQKSVTYDHDIKIDGITLVESWIIKDSAIDKSALFGFNLPIGTWMISLKVDNTDIWENYVKTGKVKGFSIEGSFQRDDSKLLMDEIEAILQEAN